MSQNVGFAAAAVAAGVGAKAIALPTPFAGLLAGTVFAICFGVSKFLHVEAAPKPQKKKKLSKKEKRALAAANEPEEEEVDAVEDAAKLAKAAKKREKERARKEAKRAAALEQKQQAVEAKEQAEVAAQSEKKLTKDQAKKKKQKEKAKAKKAAAAAAASGETAPKKTEEAAPEEPQGWEEVKQKKGKKKPEPEEELVSAAVPAHVTQIYVERKFFGHIIGPQGTTLRAITEATGTEIEMPREGGMHHEIQISGPEAGCARAKIAINQLVTKGYSDITHAGTTDSNVDVPESKRGIVIGPKGANLKMMQEKLGVRINMPEKGSEDGVSITGDAKAVKECVATIKALMEQGYSSITHENYIKTNMEVPRDMLKNLIGPGGSIIRGLQTTHNVSINVSSEKSGEMVAVSLLGEPEAVTECRIQIATLMVPPEPTPIPEEWTQAASLQHVDKW